MKTADEAALMRNLFEGIRGYRDIGGAENHNLFDPRAPAADSLRKSYYNRVEQLKH